MQNLIDKIHISIGPSRFYFDPLKVLWHKTGFASEREDLVPLGSKELCVHTAKGSCEA